MFTTVSYSLRVAYDRMYCLNINKFVLKANMSFKDYLIFASNRLRTMSDPKYKIGHSNLLIFKVFFYSFNGSLDAVIVNFPKMLSIIMFKLHKESVVH